MANYQLTPEASSVINDAIKDYKYRILSTADSFRDSGLISADDVKCAVEFIEQRRLYQRNHLKQQRKRKLYLYVCILCLVYSLLLLMLLIYNKYGDGLLGFAGHNDSLLAIIVSVVASIFVMLVAVITFYKRLSMHGEQKLLIEQFMLLWNTTEIELRLFVGREGDGSDYSFSDMCSQIPEDLKDKFNSALEIRNRIIHGKSISMISKKEILNGIEVLKRISEMLKLHREKRESETSEM